MAIKNYCFFHVASVLKYKEITTEILESIKESGLYDNLEKIFVNVVGPGGLSCSDYDKVVVSQNGKYEEFEFPTLNMIESFCADLKDEVNILYVHTKGVTRSDTPENKRRMESWRDFLKFFTIENYGTCIKHLESGADTVAPSFRKDPIPHFSGNFWWATSGHIKSLPKINDIMTDKGPRHHMGYRYNSEFWIGMKKGWKPVNLYDHVGAAFYSSELPRKTYENHFKDKKI